MGQSPNTTYPSSTRLTLFFSSVWLTLFRSLGHSRKENTQQTQCRALDAQQQALDAQQQAEA